MHYLPNDLPPVYPGMRRWIEAGVSRSWWPRCKGCCGSSEGARASRRRYASTAARQSTPESGGRAGYDGAKRRKGSKVYRGRDTRTLDALKVTAAPNGDREQFAAVIEEVRQVAGGSVELAYVDQGYTGDHAAEAAQQHGIRLSLVKHP